MSLVRVYNYGDNKLLTDIDIPQVPSTGDYIILDNMI